MDSSQESKVNCSFFTIALRVKKTDLYQRDQKILLVASGGLLKHRKTMHNLSALQKVSQSLLRCTSGFSQKQKYASEVSGRPSEVCGSCMHPPHVSGTSGCDQNIVPADSIIRGVPYPY